MRHGIHHRYLTMLAAIACATTARAATWTVYADGSGDAPTIQQAVDLAAPGDLVRVGPGVYTDVHLDGHGTAAVLELRYGVTVESIEGPDATILDATIETGERRVVSGYSANDAALIGFTVRGGDLFTGAGIFLSGCNARIERCRIANNASGEGCGITVRGSSVPVIVSNDIRDNVACCGPGGGILVTAGAMPIIERNRITRNTGFAGGGIACVNSGWAEIRENLIRDNIGLSGGGVAYWASPGLGERNWILANYADRGGGVSCWNSGGVEMRQNVVARNTTPAEGGGYLVDGCSPFLDRETIVANGALAGSGVYCGQGSAPVIQGSIVAWNFGAEGIFCNDPVQMPMVTCSDVYGHVGGDYGGFVPNLTGQDGNVSIDPGMCDAEHGSYFLRSDSELRGDATCGIRGALDSPCPAQVLDAGGAGPGWVPPEEMGPALAVDAGIPTLRFAVSPNPAQGSVLISLPGGGAVAPRVYDLVGRLVRALPQGQGAWSWDGTTEAGRRVAAGSYWVAAPGVRPERIVLR